jgi:hypothetical protein
MIIGRTASWMDKRYAAMTVDRGIPEIDAYLTETIV